MRKVFVAVPPKYGLDDDGVRAHERKIEEAAHIAEKILDQYVEVKNLDCSFLKGDYSNSKNVKGFLFNCLYNLCEADLAVFEADWEISSECRLLHTVANAFEIPIMYIHPASKPPF